MKTLKILGIAQADYTGAYKLVGWGWGEDSPLINPDRFQMQSELDSMDPELDSPFAPRMFTLELPLDDDPDLVATIEDNAK
jgi:hypothetical protein